ncbi:MAG: DUF3800 domain-containing protein [Chloroflexi bacterium]|nr:DUF3800 domain-containing protein [Chloroflexota bacterium]
MHIVYLDESGTHESARYFIVAGVAVFERETYFLAQALDQIQAKYLPRVTGQVHFHASALRAPDGRVPAPFDVLTRAERNSLMGDIYRRIADSRASIFAIAIEKASVTTDHYEFGFEQVVSRFDQMLGRGYRDRGDQQRGLIVVAESGYRQNLEFLAQRIADRGHRWGETHNLADIPYFAPAKSTRLLQIADFVANAVFARYEHGINRDFEVIAPRLDQDNGRLHGLVHMSRDRQSCYCPACITRRVMSRPEPDDPAAA